MAKRTRTKPAAPETPKTSEVVPTHKAFLISMWITILGLVAQYVIAFIAYPSLGPTIPSRWVGWVPVGDTLPSSLVFVAYPAAQIVVFLIGYFSPKDSEGKRVMESGRTVSLILLTLLFTALQASVLRLNH